MSACPGVEYADGHFVCADHERSSKDGAEGEEGEGDEDRKSAQDIENCLLYEEDFRCVWYLHATPRAGPAAARQGLKEYHATRVLSLLSLPSRARVSMHVHDRPICPFDPASCLLPALVSGLRARANARKGFGRAGGDVVCRGNPHAGCGRSGASTA